VPAFLLDGRTPTAAALAAEPRPAWLSPHPLASPGPLLARTRYARTPSSHRAHFANPASAHHRLRTITPRRLTPASALAQLRRLSSTHLSSTHLSSTHRGHLWRLGETLWSRADGLRLRRQLWKWRYRATRSAALTRHACARRPALCQRRALRRLAWQAWLRGALERRCTDAARRLGTWSLRRALLAWCARMADAEEAAAYRCAADFSRHGRARSARARALVAWRARVTSRAHAAAKLSASRELSLRCAVRVWRLRLPRLVAARAERRYCERRRLRAVWERLVQRTMERLHEACKMDRVAGLSLGWQLEKGLATWRRAAYHEARDDAFERFEGLRAAHRLRFALGRWAERSAEWRHAALWDDALRRASLGCAMERWRRGCIEQAMTGGPAGDMHGLLWV
jgi:hypothetical protein